ncbi:MAG: DUF2142 domain-containing protein [bacterium]|nr:DUF2142 domain-containing protein [bacterium]
MQLRFSPSRGLAILLLSVALKGVLLAFLVPAWQQPDEPAHFQYTQLMVEERRLPVSAGATLYLSPEVTRSVIAHSYQDKLPLPPAVRIQLSAGGIPADFPNRLVFGITPVNPASVYGPLYYALLAMPYNIFNHASLEHRLIAMRLMSVLLFLGVFLIAYGIAFTLRPRRGFALAVAAAVGWHPMAAYIFSGVNNDTLFIFLATLAFWLLIHIRNRRLTVGHLVLITTLCTLGVFTKAPFVIFLPLFLWVICRKITGLTVWVRAVTIVALVIFPATVVLLWHQYVTVPAFPGATAMYTTEVSQPMLTIGRFTYLTLFYRPWRVFISFWGVFGWLVHPLHAYSFTIVMLLVGVAAIGVVRLIKDALRRAVSLLTPEIFFLPLVSLLFLEGLYLLLFWRALIVYNYPEFPNQGRYYFPLLVPFIILCFVGIERLVPQRLHQYGAWGLATLLLMLNIDALVVMLRAWA